MADNALSDEGTAHICAALENSSLQILDLSKTGSGEKTAFALSKALALNFRLTSLDLGNNGLVGDTILAQLASGISHNSTLKKLNLSYNCLGDSGATILAPALYKSGISDLQVSSCTLSGHGISALLGKWQKPIDNKDGACSKASNIFCLSANSAAPCLTCLNLLGNKVGNEGVDHFVEFLGAHPSLKCVGLSGLGLTEEGIVSLVAGLAANTILEIIELGGNSVGPTGQKSIVEFCAKRESVGNSIDIAYDKFSQNDAADGGNVMREQEQIASSLDDDDDDMPELL